MIPYIGHSLNDKMVKIKSNGCHWLINGGMKVGGKWLWQGKDNMNHFASLLYQCQCAGEDIVLYFCSMSPLRKIG